MSPSQAAQPQEMESEMATKQKFQIGDRVSPKVALRDGEVLPVWSVRWVSKDGTLIACGNDRHTITAKHCVRVGA